MADPLPDPVDNPPITVDNRMPVWRNRPPRRRPSGSALRSPVPRAQSLTPRLRSSTSLSPIRREPSTTGGDYSTDLLSVDVRPLHILHTIITMMTR